MSEADSLADALNRRERGYPQSEPQTSTQKSANQIAYDRAVAVTNQSARDIFSVGILEFRRSLLKERGRPRNSIRTPPYTVPDYRGADKQTFAKYILHFQDYFKHLHSKSYLKAMVSRGEHVLTAEHYAQCEHANAWHQNVEGSLYVFLAEIWFPDWVENLYGLSETKRHKAKLCKWRDKLVIARRWQKLDEKYGRGILSLLPGRLMDGNLKKLKDSDVDALLALIDREHPGLKETLKDLSELTSHLLIYGEIPRQRLLIEVLDEQEVLRMLSGSPEKLLNFVDSSSSCSSNLAC